MGYRPRNFFVTLWILLCAYCTIVGWSLSVLGQLNEGGYAIATGLALAAFGVWKWKTGAVIIEGHDFPKLRRRFARFFPLGFLVIACLVIAGGVLHAPVNYDGLAYRTPRVLHWLAAGRWHWIHTDFHRLNTRGCTFEWMTAPMFALAHTDRFEFILNAISFLLIPGRVFSIWTRLGVRPRVAWYWMWLFPTGYCYILQGGSSANDIFGALLSMTAIEFALRARQSGKMGHLVVAILAAALMTSGKAFNLLLGLPWVLAAGPALWLLLRRPLVSAATIVVAAVVSLIPTAVLNYHYCGDWTGQKAEHIVILGSASPAFRVAVNSILLPLHNFTPPIFPFTSSWAHLMQRVISPALNAKLEGNFEPVGAHFTLPEMQMEETAGLGFGVSLLLLATLIYRWRTRPKARVPATSLFREALQVRWLVWLATCAAVLVFMTQSGLACPARYLSPFYALLIAPVLAGDGALLRWLRGRSWRMASLAVFALATVVLILSPTRPLWPAVTVLKAFGADKSSQPLVKRAWTVYSVFGDRGNAFEPAIEILPPDANPLGIVTSDDPEGTLWKPFGSRRIEHVCLRDGPEYLRERHIKYVLVNSFIVTHHYESTMDAWLKKYNAEAIQSVMLTLKASVGPIQWWLVKVRD